MGRHGVGYDQIDVDAATARGVQVVYTPGANTQSVAEHVFALMIGLSKHFTPMTAELIADNYHARTSMTGPRDRRQDHRDRRLRPDRPPRRRDRPPRLRHERSSTTTSSRRPRRSSAAVHARRMELRELLEASDYVTLHVPLDASTRGLINPADARADASRRDPDQHRRGPVVDEAAVAEALDAGRLWGYGADVFTVEPPPPGHPLIGRPRRPAHAPQRGPDRGVTPEHGDHDRRGSPRRPRTGSCRSYPGQRSRSRSSRSGSSSGWSRSITASGDTSSGPSDRRIVGHRRSTSGRFPGSLGLDGPVRRPGRPSCL